MGGLRFALFRFGLAVAALMAMLGGIAHAQTGQDSNPLPHMAPSIPSRPSEAGSGHQKPGDMLWGIKATTRLTKFTSA